MRPPLVILAGGKGTRLGELTNKTPKPMVNVCGKPFLYWLIDHYRIQGFKEIIISTGYLAEVIESYPWPTEWEIRFINDRVSGHHLNFFNAEPGNGHWVVNGDTWISEALPHVKSGFPLIVINDGRDAGAHYVDVGKTLIYNTSMFIDMGTPGGLAMIRSHIKHYYDLP